MVTAGIEPTLSALQADALPFKLRYHLEKIKKAFTIICKGFVCVVIVHYNSHSFAESLLVPIIQILKFVLRFLIRIFIF